VLVAGIAELGGYDRALAIVTAISTIALYVGYILPVILARPQSGWRAEAVWNLGRYSSLVSSAAIAWTAFIVVIFVMPPNQLAGESFAALLVILAALYWLRVRARLRAPAWTTAAAAESLATAAAARPGARP
jgi:hypothetical protein